MLLDRRYANIPRPSLIAYTVPVVFAIRIPDHSRLLLNAFESDLLPPAWHEGRGSGIVNTM